MSGIFGLLGMADNERAFVNTVGQRVVFDAANRYVEEVQRDLDRAMSVFVSQITEDYKERYKLPGGGRLQRRSGQTQSAATRAYGSWDCAYPLEDFGAQVTGSDVDLAYMTVQDVQRELDTVKLQAENSLRYEILYRIFNATNRTFVDPIHGSLTVVPLANGDAVTYPPVLGSETEATENHYLESGYAASAISDTNNPLVTIVGELEEHFGIMTGGENIAVFISSSQVAKVSALSLFDEVIDSNIRAGSNVSVPTNLPNVPGRIIGRGYGAWVIEWPWIVNGWAFGTHLGEEQPLKMRVDPADTGLPRGLQLVARTDDFPMVGLHYRNRFGIGTGNRLNGVALEFGTGGTYTAMTGYT